MMEKNKLLITEALDEKALLSKRIHSKIESAKLVDFMKHNEDKVCVTMESEEEFRKNALASYQQIMDLIQRYQKLEAAIIVSNAITQIETSYGKMSVAAAIAMRNRLRESEKIGVTTSFEYMLEQHLQCSYSECLRTIGAKNQRLQETASTMRLTILGKEKAAKDDISLEVVEAYIKENTMEIVDPLGVLKKIDELKTKRTTLLTELETMIKISNATTFVEV